MTISLHRANIGASRKVCPQQFAFACGIWQADRMKLKLKNLRLDRGLTIDQLADLSGISRGHISLLENGKRQPSADALQTLATSLRVRVTDMIDEGRLEPDLATLINVLSALDSDQREEILRHAAAMLPRRSS